MVVQSVSICLFEIAIAVSPEIGTIGILRLQAMVLAIVTPIRIPVKDPGPVTTMILSKSFGVILAFLKTSMILVMPL